jgi:hypothetical protein
VLSYLALAPALGGAAAVDAIVADASEGRDTDPALAMSSTR